MIKLVVYRTSDHNEHPTIAEMFAALDKALECGKRAGIEHRYAAEPGGFVYWYEFATEEEAALFKLTHM